MNYAVLLYADERVWPAFSDHERQTLMQAHDDFAEAVRSRANMLGGDALADSDTATTLRHDAGDRPVLTDGPFAETVEQLGGFYLVEADDLNIVTSLCELLPHYYTVEIRPVLDMSSSDDEPGSEPETASRGTAPG